MTIAPGAAVRSHHLGQSTGGRCPGENMGCGWQPGRAHKKSLQATLSGLKRAFVAMLWVATDCS
eukprot:13227191-Alexandrium_andersonii.AAC.1